MVNVLLSGPIFSRSGYGQHTRLIVDSLLTMTDKINLKIVPTQWGTTPQTAINAKYQPYLQLEQLQSQPDVFIMVSIPNEMQRVGKKNILITAGTESSVCSPEFVEGCNRADLVIVPSEFTKKVLSETIIEKRESRTNTVIESLRCNTPIKVLFEGVDTNVFNKNPTSVFDLSNVKESFCFLFVGTWLQGILGEDRKNVGALVRVFYDTFRKKGLRNRPALILKTNGAGFSEVEKHDVEEKLRMIAEGVDYKGQLPSVYLLNGDLTDDEMNGLYNHPKVKCMVSLQHAEGFGLPLLEFTTVGKPVLTSNYSGPVDFLSKEHGAILIPGQTSKIHDSAANQWIVRGSDWFTPSYQFASQVMEDMVENYDKYYERSRKHAKYTRDNFSLEKMTEKLSEYLTDFIEDKKTFTINVPKLKKL